MSNGSYLAQEGEITHTKARLDALFIPRCFKAKDGHRRLKPCLAALAKDAALYRGAERREAEDDERLKRPDHREHMAPHGLGAPSAQAPGAVLMKGADPA